MAEDYTPGNLKRSARPLLIYRCAGIAIIGSLVTVGAIWPEVTNIPDGIRAMDWRYSALYFVTLCLTGAWIWSTWYELDYILCKWLHPEGYAPPTDLIEAIVIIAYAIFLVALFFSVKRIEWYVGIFAFYSLVNIFVVGFHLLAEIAWALKVSEKRFAIYKNLNQNKPNHSKKNRSL